MQTAANRVRAGVLNFIDEVVATGEFPQPIYMQKMRLSALFMGGAAFLRALIPLAAGGGRDYYGCVVKGAYWFRLIVRDAGGMSRMIRWPR